MPLGRMNKSLVYLFGFFLLVFMPAGKGHCSMPSQKKELPADTSELVTKNISRGDFNSYFSKKEFWYTTRPPVIQGFWDKFWYKIEKILGFAFGNKVISTLFISVIVVIFVLLILLLVGGGGFQSFFSRNRSISGAVSPFRDEHIDSVDFDALISEEVEKGNLNWAVRFLYLKLLQVLSKKQLIRWQKDKTNREYIQELSEKAFYNDFKQLTSTYEYVWYGKFQVSAQVFNDVRSHVNQLIHQIND